MASFLRKEIQAAVREEVSRVISTTSTAISPDTASSSTRTATSHNSASTSSSAEDNCERTLSFSEFYALREQERQEGFKPPKKKKKTTPSGKLAMPTNKATDVEVKVGITSLVDGIFKARRGKTHSVTVKSTADKDEITRKAIAKHSSFDQNFDGAISYVLLFPDFSEVNFVPGTKELFELSSYKKAIGKDYRRLTFFLISAEEFADRYDDTDNSSEEERVKAGGIAKYFHPKERIDVDLSDDKSDLDAAANLEGEYVWLYTVY